MWIDDIDDDMDDMCILIPIKNILIIEKHDLKIISLFNHIIN